MITAIKQNIRKGSPSNAIKFMIVEDDPFYSEYLEQEILALALPVEIMILAVNCRKQALEQAASFEPHIIICDVYLSGADPEGYQIVRELREKDDVCYICMNSSHDSGIEFDERSHQAGANEALPKPLDRHSLVRIIGQATATA